MLVVQISKSDMIMKRATDKSEKKRLSRKSAVVQSRETSAEALRSHYDFDYSQSRPNRFASRLTGETVAVVLDPDVAGVFRSSKAVNSFLRSAIEAMSEIEPRKKKRAS